MPARLPADWRDRRRAASPRLANKCLNRKQIRLDLELSRRRGIGKIDNFAGIPVASPFHRKRRLAWLATARLFSRSRRRLDDERPSYAAAPDKIWKASHGRRNRGANEAPLQWTRCSAPVCGGEHGEFVIFYSIFFWSLNKSAVSLNFFYGKRPG